jgi:hypothetical protein
MDLSALPLLIWLTVSSCDSATSSTWNSLNGRHLRVIWVVQDCDFISLHIYWWNKFSRKKKSITWMWQNNFRFSLVGKATQRGCLGHSKAASLIRWSEWRKTDWSHQKMGGDFSVTSLIKLSLPIQFSAHYNLHIISCKKLEDVPKKNKNQNNQINCWLKTWFNI